jgi:CRP-like cAMP-binding protein
MFFNRGDDWLHELPADSQALVRQKMSIVELADGETLFQQGETAASIYQVVSGLIHLKRITVSGSESIVTLYQGGNCFGEIPLLSATNSARGYNAIAVGPTQIACLSKKDFEEIASRHPEVYQNLIAKLCLIIRNLLQHAEDISNANLSQRLAHLIVDAARCHGVKQADHTCINIPLSQQDISKMLGVTRQSVQRQLQQWREEGWLEKKHGRFLVYQLDKLKQQMKSL